MALRYFATKAEHFLVSLSRRTRISCMVSLHRKIQRFSMDFTSICRCSFFFLQTERKMGIIAHLPSTRNQIYGMHTRIEEKPTHTRVNCKILSIIHSTLFYMVLCPAVNENTQWWTKAKEKTQSFALSLSLSVFCLDRRIRLLRNLAISSFLVFFSVHFLLLGNGQKLCCVVLAVRHEKNPEIMWKFQREQTNNIAACHTNSIINETFEYLFHF